MPNWAITVLIVDPLILAAGAMLVYPTPQGRHRARGAGQISARLRKPLQTRVLGAEKYLQQPAVRDGLQQPHHVPIEADRAMRCKGVAPVPACQGRGQVRL